MTDGTPARIDRAALERIIQRAAELQTSERDIGESLTPDEVLALGKEVGIPGRYLQQALLEERTRLVSASPGGVLDRAVGPGEIAAQRVVRGEAEAIEHALVGWLEERELFCVQRQQPGRITWEPIGGIQATIRRATAAAGGSKQPMMLARAETVAATVLDLEPGFMHVALTATARKARTESVAGSAALAGSGGEALVKLRIAEAMQGKRIMLLPVSEGGMNLKTTDINQLIQTMGVKALGEGNQGKGTGTAGGVRP